MDTIIGGRTALAVLLGVVLLCSEPVHAQTAPVEDLTGVFAGVLSIIKSARNWEENGGQNLDGSVKWKYIGGEAKNLLRVSFKDFRYYIAKETGTRVAALSGNLEMDDDEGSLSGGVTVKGIPAVSSLDFIEYNFDLGSGLVKVGGRPYDNGIVEELFDDAGYLLDKGNVITTETEAAVMFSLMVASIMETDLPERLGHLNLDGNTVPPGITSSNSRGTLKMITRENAFEILFTSYKLEKIFFGSPVLDGQFIVGYQAETAFEELRFDGAVQIKNMPFVSSMRFDSCVLGDGNDNSGFLTINGVRHEFRTFVKSLRAVTLPLD